MNAIISNAIVRTLDVKGASYFARPAGSSVDGLDVSDGNAVAAFLLAHNWEEVTEEAGNIGARFGACRYFRANINEGYSGQEGIALLGDLSDAELGNVRIVKGHHGNLELQLAGQTSRPTQVMHLILCNGGNFPAGEVNEDTSAVVTWYPGRLTGPIGMERAVVKFIR
jgi:hypothetical protein